MAVPLMKPSDGAAVSRRLPPPRRELRVSVVIPVRNEAHRLHATLAALVAQRHFGGKALDPRCFELIVLANNCSDASADVVRAFARAHPAHRIHAIECRFAPRSAHVGSARRVLMDCAYTRLRSLGTPGVIASTDGDTRVDGHWLAATLASFDAGADAVVGRIFTDSEVAPAPAALRLQRLDTACCLARARLESLLDADPADPWPRHHQHFGASFALTTVAYARVGGLPLRPFLEDQALYGALRRVDLSVRHDPEVRVLTSNRREGRVEVGLSSQLKQWEKAALRPGHMRFPDPRPWLDELLLRRALREAWRAVHAEEAEVGCSIPPRWGELALALGVPMRWLMRRGARSPHFGALWESVIGRRTARPDAPPIDPALSLQLLRDALNAELARHRAAPHIDGLRPSHMRRRDAVGAGKALRAA